MVVTLCPFGSRGSFCSLLNPCAIQKVSNFRLACAKGETVARTPKTLIFSPLGQPFPRISPDPLGSINPLGQPFPEPLGIIEPRGSGGILRDHERQDQRITWTRWVSDPLDPLGGAGPGG